MINDHLDFRLMNTTFLQPLFRMEYPYPEESKIFDIEVEIGNASADDKPRKIEKRQNYIKKWIDRIENNLSDQRSKERIEELKKELARAQEYQQEDFSRHQTRGRDN